jgi:predicted RNase H-like nuclease (RuvC/YqgF family)
MSDTPRTDAETWRDEMDHVDTEYTFAQSATVSADFARQLERELAEAKFDLQFRRDLYALQSKELAKTRELLIKCLSIMPVGYVPTHTVENLPEMIGDLAKALTEETTEREQLERELAEARSMTEGQWLLKVAARLVTAGCKSDGIVDAMDELIQQRDRLAEALKELRNNESISLGGAAYEIVEQALQSLTPNEL